MTQETSADRPPAEGAPSDTGAAPAHRSEAPVQVRPVTLGDARAVYDLVTTTIAGHFPEADEWASLWRWRCWDNPWRGDGPAGWVLTAGDRIIGHLGAVHVPLRVGPHRTRAVIGVDYAVAGDAPAAGALGGLRLAETFFASARQAGCVAMATTANEQTAAVFARFGCQPVCWTRELWRASATPTGLARACLGTRSRTIRRLLVGRFGPKLAPLLVRHCLRRKEPPTLGVPDDCYLETTIPKLSGDLGWTWEAFACAASEVWPSRRWPIHAGSADDDHHQGWRTRSKGGRRGDRHAGEPASAAGSTRLISIDRTQAYLQWRYGGHPQRDRIRILAVRNSDRYPLGAAVLFLEDRPSHRVAIVEDLIVLPDYPGIVRTLLCASLKLAQDQDCEYLLTTTGRRAIRHLFAELGFELRSRSAPALVIQPPDNLPVNLPIEDCLDFWHGEML